MVRGATLSLFLFLFFLIPYLLVLSLEIPHIIPYSFRLQKFIIYQVVAQLMININQSFDSPKQDMHFPV
jgi:isoleucyl-tRNA synthetase